MEPLGQMWRPDSVEAGALAEVATARMSELRSSVYAAEDAADLAASFADVVQTWDLARFVSLLDRFLEIPTVAVSLLQCGAVDFNASAGAFSSELLREPWGAWVVKTWSYLHFAHGVNFTYDAFNIPYAILMHCLAKRCGLLEGERHEICPTCAGQDILATAVAARRVPAGPVCLAYVVHRHNLSFLETSVKGREKLGEVLEAVGAMCDITQARPRAFQAAMSKNFGLTGLALAGAAMSGGHAEDVWKISTHIFVQLCTHAVEIYKSTRALVSYGNLLKSLLDRIPSSSTSSSATCPLCEIVAQVCAGGQEQSGAAAVGAPPGLEAPSDSANGGNGGRRGAASSRVPDELGDHGFSSETSDPQRRDHNSENAWDWQESSGWDTDISGSRSWGHEDLARSSGDDWSELWGRRGSASGSWQTEEWASAWGKDSRAKRSWFEDSRSRCDEFVGSDAAKRARLVSTTVSLVASLRGPEYKNDFRFAVRKTPDANKREVHRQYVCDSCKSIVTRKSSRCPEFDGEFCCLQEIPEGQRGPGRLEEAWLGGWDATWWCTNCHLLHRWKLTAPFSEALKNRMRFELKILKKEVLDRLRAASLEYRLEDDSLPSLPKLYPIFERDYNSS